MKFINQLIPALSTVTAFISRTRHVHVQLRPATRRSSHAILLVFDVVHTIRGGKYIVQPDAKQERLSGF